MIVFKNATIRKEIPENENPNNIVDIIEKILDFNKQQKLKVIKMLSLQQLLQRLPISHAQLKQVKHLTAY